jgi:hypothetical protein
LAGLDRVRVTCDGKSVADHERIWARHQTISDPEHVTAVDLRLYCRAHSVVVLADWA